MRTFLLTVAFFALGTTAVLADGAAMAGASASIYVPHQPDQQVCRKIGNDIFIMGDLEILNSGFGQWSKGASDLTTATSVAKQVGDTTLYVWHAGDQMHPSVVRLPTEWSALTSDQVLEVCFGQDMRLAQ